MSTTPFQRIQIGAFGLLAVFATAVVAYKITGSYSWFDAVWMFVITVSTVGYSESSDTEFHTKLITLFVIVFGISASAYAIGGFLQKALEGEVERALGIRKMNKEISKLKDHVIICGFGRLGMVLAKQLTHRGVPLIVVDDDPETIEDAEGFSPLMVLGDALLESTMEKARIDKARSIVAVLPADADNVFITLTARNLNPDIQILAKCEHVTTSNKLRQAGADRIIMPHQIGAKSVERMISRPMTADLMELFDEATQSEIELDEMLITPSCKLVGETLMSSNIRNKYDLLVVGIKNANGKLFFNPSADTEIGVGDTLLVMGPHFEVEKLRNANNALSQ